jgi:hypothetical protein
MPLEFEKILKVLCALGALARDRANALEERARKK